ncbi:MAG TPA: transcription termination factor Rho [Candidatus Dojkabacteria bacterium]|nr:transcription termination factor Rho [Candidatus Dojkabacteria bacterium]
MKLSDLTNASLKDLRTIAKDLGVKGVAEMARKDVVVSILREHSIKGEELLIEGILEIMPDLTHGVIRTDGLFPGEHDVYISGTQIRKFNLKTGDEVLGPVRMPNEGERYLSLLKIQTVNGQDPNLCVARIPFNKITPVFPDKQIVLETKQEIASTRIIDLLCPIGFGQRGMIVSPPKAGKTTILQDIAHGIEKNYPDVVLMVLLVGERPEEVTDMSRSVKGQVWASNFDEKPEEHTKIAEMVLERAKRLAEMGRDVVILMDSITRLARAYNIVMPTSGKTLTGGFDPVALYPPKRFFGAARNFEHGGSLTILATALVDTGSRMDDLIYEEFKGTGNMELHLDRRLQEQRIFPAIDVLRSGTRKEELLLKGDMLNNSWRVRRMLEELKKSEEFPTSAIIEQLQRTKNNAEFVAKLAGG